MVKNPPCPQNFPSINFKIFLMVGSLQNDSQLFLPPGMPVPMNSPDTLNKGHLCNHGILQK